MIFEKCSEEEVKKKKKGLGAYALVALMIVELQVNECPGGQITVSKRPLGGDKKGISTLLPHFHHVSLSLPSLSFFSSPTRFPLTLYHFSLNPPSKVAWRPMSSIKFLPSFATQGNFLSSNLLLFHGYGRIFFED